MSTDFETDKFSRIDNSYNVFFKQRKIKSSYKGVRKVTLKPNRYIEKNDIKVQNQFQTLNTGLFSTINLAPATSFPSKDTIARTIKSSGCNRSKNMISSTNSNIFSLYNQAQNYKNLQEYKEEQYVKSQIKQNVSGCASPMIKSEVSSCSENQYTPMKVADKNPFFKGQTSVTNLQAVHSNSHENIQKLLQNINVDSRTQSPPNFISYRLSKRISNIRFQEVQTPNSQKSRNISPNSRYSSGKSRKSVRSRSKQKVLEILNQTIASTEVVQKTTRFNKYKKGDFVFSDLREQQQAQRINHLIENLNEISINFKEQILPEKEFYSPLYKNDPIKFPKTTKGVSKSLISKINESHKNFIVNNRIEKRINFTKKPEEIQREKDEIFYQHFKPYIRELTREDFTFEDFFQYLREQKVRDILNDYQASFFKNQSEMDQHKSEKIKKQKKREDLLNSQDYQNYVKDLIQMCDSNFVQKIKDKQYVKTHKEQLIQNFLTYLETRDKKQVLKDMMRKDKESYIAKQYQDQYLKVIDKGEKNKARRYLDETRQIRDLAVRTENQEFSQFVENLNYPKQQFLNGIFQEIETKNLQTLSSRNVTKFLFFNNPQKSGDESQKIENKLKNSVYQSFMRKKKFDIVKQSELRNFLTKFVQDKQKHAVFDDFQKNCENYGGLEFMVDIFSLRIHLLKFFKFGTLGEIYNDAKINIFDIETYEKDSQPNDTPQPTTVGDIFEKDLTKVEFYNMAKFSQPHLSKTGVSDIEKVNKYLRDCNQYSTVPIPPKLIFENQLISNGQSLAIGEHISGKKIQILKLVSCGLKDAGFANILRNVNEIKEIQYENNEFGANSCKEMSRILESRKIKKINISNVSSHCMADFTSQIVIWNSLISLRLSKINLDNPVIIENLCEIQSLGNLQELDLSWCSIRAKFLYQISQKLNIKKLRKINLSYNNVNTIVIRDTKKKPKDKKDKKNKEIEEINKPPPYDIGFISNMINFANQSESLNHLNLSGMGLESIQRPLFLQLAQALANCQTLEAIHLSDNDLKRDDHFYPLLLAKFAIFPNPIDPPLSLKPHLMTFDPSINLSLLQTSFVDPMIYKDHLTKSMQLKKVPKNTFTDNVIDKVIFTRILNQPEILYFNQWVEKQECFICQKSREVCVFFDQQGPNEFIQIQSKTVIKKLDLKTKERVPMINIQGKWQKMLDLNYYALLSIIQNQTFNKDEKMAEEVTRGVKAMQQKPKLKEIMINKLSGYQLVVKDKFKRNNVSGHTLINYPEKLMDSYSISDEIKEDEQVPFIYTAIMPPGHHQIVIFNPMGNTYWYKDLVVEPENFEKQSQYPTKITQNQIKVNLWKNQEKIDFLKIYQKDFQIGGSKKLMKNLGCTIDYKSNYSAVYYKFNEIISKSNSYPKIDQEALLAFYGEQSEVLQLQPGDSLNRPQFLNFLIIINDLPQSSIDFSFQKSETLESLLLENEQGLRLLFERGPFDLEAARQLVPEESRARLCFLNSKSPEKEYLTYDGFLQFLARAAENDDVRVPIYKKVFTLLQSFERFLESYKFTLPKGQDFQEKSAKVIDQFLGDESDFINKFEEMFKK